MLSGAAAVMGGQQLRRVAASTVSLSSSTTSNSASSQRGKCGGLTALERGDVQLPKALLNSINTWTSANTADIRIPMTTTANHSIHAPKLAILESLLLRRLVCLLCERGSHCKSSVSVHFDWVGKRGHVGALRVFSTPSFRFSFVLCVWVYRLCDGISVCLRHPTHTRSGVNFEAIKSFTRPISTVTTRT